MFVHSGENMDHVTWQELEGIALRLQDFLKGKDKLDTKVRDQIAQDLATSLGARKWIPRFLFRLMNISTDNAEVSLKEATVEEMRHFGQTPMNGKMAVITAKISEDCVRKFYFLGRESIIIGMTLYTFYAHM